MKDSIEITREEWTKLKDAVEGAMQEAEKVQHDIEVYKVALEYFAGEGGKPARDIIKNLLGELEVKR